MRAVCVCVCVCVRAHVLCAHVLCAHMMWSHNTTTLTTTTTQPLTVRSVFFVGPDHKVKALISYPPSVGRHFDEIVRVIDALQLGAKHTIATPANWTPGHKVMILPSVSAADAAARFPGFEVRARCVWGCARLCQHC